MLDMTHSGIVCLNSPVECFLNIKMPLPQGGSYPHEPPFYLATKSLRISDIAPNILLMQPL